MAGYQAMPYLVSSLGVGYEYGVYLDYGYTDDVDLCQQRCQAFSGNKILNCTEYEYIFIASYYRQLSADIKMKTFKIKTSLISPKGAKGPGL